MNKSEEREETEWKTDSNVCSLHARTSRYTINNKPTIPPVTSFVWNPSPVIDDCSYFQEKLNVTTRIFNQL